MKKDRNCGMMGYPQMVPGMMPMMPYTNVPDITYNNYDNSDSQKINSRLNSLEQRVNKLESIVNNGYSNGYNSSNYQMM